MAHIPQGVSPVPDRPLLFLKKEKVLIAADLHIGIEREMRDAGVHVPKQWPVMASMFFRALHETGAKRLVLLGDVKHRIPYASFSEEKDVSNMFHSLLEKVDVEVIPGNHDGWLKRIVPPGVLMHGARGITLGGLGLFHGHCWPSEDVMSCKTLVMGHIHPSIAFSDEIGTRSIMPCWLRAKYTAHESEKDVVVLPAVSRLRRGTPVNGGKGIGPIARSGNMDMSMASVHLLDGTFLGAAGGIR